MLDYIFNGTNLLVLIVFGFFCYGFWMPYFRGKKTGATVDGYAHPEKGDKREVTWVCRFQYRDEKGRKCHCYSKRIFDTQPEVIGLYPKGSKVTIRVYKESPDDKNEIAMIVSDREDLKKTLFLTLAAFLCCIALSVGFQMYEKNFR